MNEIHGRGISVSSVVACLGNLLGFALMHFGGMWDGVRWFEF